MTGSIIQIGFAGNSTRHTGYNGWMNTFTLIFLLALASGSLLQLWLAARQARSVNRHRDQVPEAFASHITPEAHRKAADYTLARLPIERWNLILSAIMVLIWTLGGGLDWLARLAQDLPLPDLWRNLALVLAVVVIDSLLDLPLDLWSTFGVEQRFGFNRTTPWRFARDKLLEFVLILLLGIPLLLSVIWLMQHAGHYWWLWVWVVWIGFTLLVSWIFPTWIAPLFNRFEPLPDGPLRQRLEQLLARCGFQSKGMYVMDGSSRSSHGNAYFTGFGRNKRIVFYDTLLEGMQDGQIEAVLAHELGHFKRHHVLKMLLLNALMSLLGLALLAWLAQQPWFFHDLGVTRQTPATTLALFILVLPVFSVFISPLLSMLSRKHEFEADAFAAQQASARDLINGLLAMYRDNASTLTPDPLYATFHHSHPAAAERISHLSRLDRPEATLATETTGAPS